MSNWFDVVEEETLAPGGVYVIDIEGIEVAVFNVMGSYYAIEDICTHDGSEISSGCLFEYAIECPRHGAQFDIRTGEVLEPPAYESVETFPVRVEKGMIQVCDAS
jgi:3-phenylpropionate/trans-cinnamate dioxygenase ferredoxin subunit